MLHNVLNIEENDLISFGQLGSSQYHNFKVHWQRFTKTYFHILQQQHV